MELKELKEAIDKHGETQAAFIEKNDQRLKLIEEKNYAPADLEGEVKSLSASLSDQEAEIKKLFAALNRSPKGEEAGEEKSDTCKAALQYIKHGEQSLSSEQKSLISTDDTQAGYAIPKVMGSIFDETIRELSPFRQLANVLTMSQGNSMTFPINKKGGINAKWRAEKDQYQETGNPSLGQLVINIHLADGLAFATREMLEDSAINIEQWLATEAGEDFVALENSAFFYGDGAGKPRGFLTYVDLGGDRNVASVASGDAAKFTRDGIVKLRGGIKTAYLQGAAFMANRASITEIRLLKDDEGRYSLINDFSQGPGTTLLGHPLIEAPDMPDVAANAYPLAFGNFNQGYQIVDRKQVTLERFNEIYNPFIGFMFSKRVGGDLKKGEAIVVQKIAV